MLEFKNREELDAKICKAKSHCHLASGIRGILALALVIFVICLLSLKNYLLYGILSGSFFILFLSSVVLSAPLYRNLSNLEHEKKAYLRHEQRRGKNFSHFADNGNEFKDKEDYKLADLDIFGPRSLYQYLSDAKTPKGRCFLARQLKNPSDFGEGFTQMVSMMAEEEKTIALEASLAEFQKGSLEYKNDDFATGLKNPVRLKISYFLPFLSFILMIVYLSLMVPLKWNYYVPLAFLAANLLLTKLCIKDEILKKDAVSLSYTASLYHDLAKSMAALALSDEYYEGLRKRISGSLTDIKKTLLIYSALRIRKNILFNVFLNLFLSFDFFVILYVHFLDKNGIDIEDATNAIATCEVALSLKNIGMDNEYSTIPDDGDVILGEEMYHPFVKNCVSNSLTLDGGIILTGSNMSGKTTFMRTLGVCEILKNAGGIVPARRFSSPSLSIYTSLRANDMLQEGVSTFYAEIKRMKKIHEAIKAESCLILVDEIFKGTNAKERIEASLKVIENLNLHHAFFIVSTHDFEICEAKNVKNYHFEEQYLDDKISFDYTLKEGTGTRGNAMYLLKMMGILEE